MGEALSAPAEPPKTAPEITDVVLLVHGIRTHAAWQVMVTDVLESPTVRVIPIKYGYFNSVRFLAPFETSREPVQRLEREIREVRESYPGARISIIAHSFGTYVVSKILQEDTDIRIHRIVFCGSVVKESFRWNQVKSRIGGTGDREMRRFVVNECGTRDIWPILGKSAGWGYGAAGTDGFGASLVTDRYHQGGHALYFNREFVEKYWKSFIHDGEIVYGEGDPNQSVPLSLRALGALPLNWALLLAPLLVLAAFILLRPGVQEEEPKPLPTYQEVVDVLKTKSNEDAREAYISSLNEAPHRAKWRCTILKVTPEGAVRYVMTGLPDEKETADADRAMFVMDDGAEIPPDAIPGKTRALTGVLGPFNADFLQFSKSRFISEEELSR